MHVILPINFVYLRDRYQIHGKFADFLKHSVVPDFVSRLSLDSRVSTVELISDTDFRSVMPSVDKVVLTRHVIDPSLGADEVSSEILSNRRIDSRVVAQCNPLYPFVSVESLWRAHLAVQNGTAASAGGSLTDKFSVRDSALAAEYDLGIFTVYSVDGFRRGPGRISLPFDVIGLRAVELIGLRNAADYDLFDLIVNSGFEL